MTFWPLPLELSSLFLPDCGNPMSSWQSCKASGPSRTKKTQAHLALQIRQGENFIPPKYRDSSLIQQDVSTEEETSNPNPLRIKRISFLFCGPLEEVGCFRMQTFYLLWEAYGHKSCCWHSGWRVEGLRGSNGGNSNQGFPIKQSVHLLLLSKGLSWYRPRQTGEGKHNSVWGCFVNANLCVLNLVIVKKKEGKGYFWSHWYYCASSPGAQES